MGWELGNEQEMSLWLEVSDKASNVCLFLFFLNKCVELCQRWKCILEFSLKYAFRGLLNGCCLYEGGELR